MARLDKLKDDESYDVRVQLMLSLSRGIAPEAAATAKYVLDKNPKNEMFTAVKASLARTEDVKKFGAKLGSLDEQQRKLVSDGAIIFRSLCSTCHGPDGKGLPTKVAPPLVV
jgi:hypothetical protein